MRPGFFVVGDLYIGLGGMARTDWLITVLPSNTPSKQTQPRAAYPAVCDTTDLLTKAAADAFVAGTSRGITAMAASKELARSRLARATPN